MSRAPTPPAAQPRRDHDGSRVCSTTQGRADMLAFYGEVFGWTEGDNTGEAGNPLILYTGAFGEFVYLLPGDPYLTAPALDHFGFQVASLDELHEIVERRQGVRRARRAGAHHRRARAHDARPGRTTTRSRARTSGSCCRS